MKIHNFRGDVTSISAETKALLNRLAGQAKRGAAGLGFELQRLC